MWKKKSRKKHLGERGQSVMEFVLFAPFFVASLFVMMNVSSSLNGAINQEKVARGAFFFYTKGSSMYPLYSELVGMRDSFGLKVVGMDSVSWTLKNDGDEQNKPPVAAAYRIRTWGRDKAVKESMDDTYPGSDGRTNFVKVSTVFGICSASFSLAGGVSDSSAIVFSHVANQSLAQSCERR